MLESHFTDKLLNTLILSWRTMQKYLLQLCVFISCACWPVIIFILFFVGEQSFICFQSVQKPAPYLCKIWSGSQDCALGVWWLSLECVSRCVSQCKVRGWGSCGQSLEMVLLGLTSCGLDTSRHVASVQCCMSLIKHDGDGRSKPFT